jgi:hypothetical protein
MAKYQYRIAGELGWMSNSGNALLAITNKNGSGKKITLREFTVESLTSSTLSPTVSLQNYFVLARATVSGGDSLSLTKHDTNAANWPATVQVVSRASAISLTTLRRVSIQKQLNPAVFSWFSRNAGFGLQSLNGLGGVYGRMTKDTAVEGIVVRANESIALVATVFNKSIPLRVTGTIVLSGSPNRTFAFEYFTSNIANDEAVFAIINSSGSGQTVILRSIEVEEVGTYDSPYFQLVPVGAVIESQNADSVSVLKMDSAYPDPSTWIEVKQDASILPFGLPENAISDSSTGSPKGFNYLKTKDFLGPVYRTVFPEYLVHRAGGMPDNPLGCSAKLADTLVRKSGITVREGEGIALVSGAETAVTTTAVGTSGWASFYFSATIDIEPKISPTLQITGLQANSEVRVFVAGTTIEVAGQENIVSGSFAWIFDPDENPAVDIAILSLGYQNLRLLNVALSLADISIPVQQQVDRQYLNP